MRAPCRRRTLAGALLLALGVANTANAASISLSTDKMYYDPGETLTLTVVADGEGESMETIAFGVSYDPSFTTGNAVAQSQEVVMNAEGGLDAGDAPGFETIMNQSNLISAQPVGVVTATAQFVISANIGVTTQFTTGIGPNWGSQPFEFGSAEPGQTSNVVGHTPEPGTAALLGLGLATLAARRYSA